MTAQLPWQLSARQDTGVFGILMSAARLSRLQCLYLSLRPAGPWIRLSTPEKPQVWKQASAGVGVRPDIAVGLHRSLAADGY